MVNKVTHGSSAKPAIPGFTEEGEQLVPLTAPSKAKGGSTQSRADRPTSFNVADFDLPGGREEEWRFTPLKRIKSLLSDEAGDAAALEFSTTAPENWVKAPLAIGAAPRGTAILPADRAAVVGYANTPEANYISVPAGENSTEPVYVYFKGQAEGTRVNGHTVIEVGENASATIVLEHTGAADYNGNVEYIVRENASLTVISLQLWDDKAKHAAQHDALVYGGGQYRQIAITIGGDLVRFNANVRYAGEGGDARLYGLYYADAGQHLEHRSFVNHNEPRNASNVLYKGALQGDGARTVWVGDVMIAKNAAGTDSYEKNQNLILTDGTRADSIPNLEIETGLIEGAGHASTTARFDETQLFYLMSRGMDETTARRLVVRGFLNEIVQQIRIPEIEERIQELLEQELAISGN
ncbi:Fe-S cluster assembly protein SufD [Micrococcoides hystricis]|uniref:Fe-S cluster assembly protein SufD n=1 Tax=Micrococcoides hystricis TaxID=1572761 RepID=A0ABV6P742_9MICC